MSKVDEWSTLYSEFINTPPKEGDILKVASDELARLDVELKEGQQPFVYARAYVPSVVGCKLGWFLQPISCQSPHGLKCILLPQSREALLKEKGIHIILGVTSLKVARWTKTGKAVLCEIEEM